MSTVTVTETIVDPSTAAFDGWQVQIDPVGSTTDPHAPVYSLGDNQTVLGPVSIDVGSDGIWSTTLHPVSELTPSGSTYKLTYYNPSAPAPRSKFISPAASPSTQRVEDILTTAPSSLDTTTAAINVTYSGSTNLSSTNVEGALDELDAEKVTLGATTLVSNQDYQILATDRRVFLNTCTASRTFTLPAASDLESGEEIMVGDLSGSLKTSGTAILLTVARSGSDTFVNSIEPAKTTTISAIRAPYSNLTFMSDGTSKWIVTNSHRLGELWLGGFNSNRSLIVPNATWTPIYFAQNYLDTTSSVTIPSATTTVAAGSNGAVLPQATINVADTTNFASSGYITITAPPGASQDTIIGYTGKTGTSFTGCNTGVNTSIATGTMATGQTVTQVMTEFRLDNVGQWITVAQALFLANATGVRGIRFRAVDGLFNFSVATGPTATASSAIDSHVQALLLPFADRQNATPLRVEVYQNSGSTLACKASGIEDPMLMSGQTSEG